MIWLIILIIVAIIVILLLWYYIPKHEDVEYPTMHARCNRSSSCGGDLVCDIQCNTCKKTQDGDCSSDVDCEFGLYCHNWKCTHIPGKSEITETKQSGDTNKKVHWNANIEETRYIEPRHK